jgi:hypothetical protein
MSCVHNYKPVEGVRAVYRCPSCGIFAHKSKARIGHGSSTELTPYKCHRTGCDQPVVVLYPVVKGRKRSQPSCTFHRKDQEIAELGPLSDAIRNFKR